MKAGSAGGPGADREACAGYDRDVAGCDDRGAGWVIQKVGKVDQASHAQVGTEYRLTFEGHEALVFGYLGAARERAKGPAPEKVEVVESVAEVGEEPGEVGEGPAEAVEELHS